MRICIVGAGAIGGYIGAKLALAGEEVTLIARGAHLEVIQRDGLILKESDGSTQVAVPALATSQFAEAGPHDVVIITVKAHAVPAMIPDLDALLGPETIIVTAQNGIPWWYFHKHGGPFDGTHLESVDPGGKISSHIEIDRIIGCVLFLASEIAEPGVVHHISGNRFILGELDGEETERIRRLAQILSKAGLEITVSPQIRAEIWFKLWGNIAFNPLSALTRATNIELCTFPPIRDVLRQMMREGRQVAQKLGIQFNATEDERIRRAEAMGHHKTSMLQDIEAGRKTEVDTLLGAVTEIARMTETPTPYLDAFYAAVKLLDQLNQTAH